MTEPENRSNAGQLNTAIKLLRHFAAELYSERTWNVNKLQQALDQLRDFEKAVGQTTTAASDAAN